MRFETKTATWAQEKEEINEEKDTNLTEQLNEDKSVKDMMDQLRVMQENFVKFKMEKKTENKVMGNLRDIINLLNTV